MIIMDKSITSMQGYLWFCTRSFSGTTYRHSRYLLKSACYRRSRVYTPATYTAHRSVCTSAVKVLGRKMLRFYDVKTWLVWICLDVPMHTSTATKHCMQNPDFRTKPDTFSNSSNLTSSLVTSYASVLHSNKYIIHNDTALVVTTSFVRQSWSMFPKIHFSHEKMTKHGRSQHIEISFSLLGTLDVTLIHVSCIFISKHLEFSYIIWQENPVNPVDQFIIKRCTIGLNSASVVWWKAHLSVIFLFALKHAEHPKISR